MTKISVLLHLTVLLEFVGKKQSFGHDFKRSTLFHKIKEGEALNGHVISVHQVRSELACAHKCLSNHKCASVNFEAQSARSLRTCELNAVSRTSSDKTLQSRDGFAYYEPLTIVKKPQQEIATLTPTTSDVLIKTAASTPTETTVSPSVVSTTAPGTKAQSARSLRTCELNAVSRTSSDKTLQSRDGFAYYEPLTIVKKPQQEITTLTPTTSDVLLIKTAASTPTETTVSPSVVPTTAPGTKAAYCGPDWYPYKAGCLRFFENRKEWSQANDYCNASSGGSGRGRLISILSENENENVTQWWSSLSLSTGDYFIGLNDKATEGSFQWVDGTVASYTNWKYEKGPKNNKYRNCVGIRMENGQNHGKWEMLPCDHSSRFICECPEGPCT
ncbi:aggrecan core protein-like [Montipora foliosa]|uniref:aggrecan core protein-like n=1 Tax=Montipora foliosa TaxID=591990 RepID=UPI0035F21339